MEQIFFVLKIFVPKKAVLKFEFCRTFFLSLSHLESEKFVGEIFSSQKFYKMFYKKMQNEMCDHGMV